MAHLFRFLVKLVFVVSAAVVGLGLLALALMVLVFSVLKALITGKRPAPAVIFRRFQHFQSGAQSNGMWSAASQRSAATVTSPSAGEVVDVEAREVRGDKRLP